MGTDVAALLPADAGQRSPSGRGEFSRRISRRAACILNDSIRERRRRSDSPNPDRNAPCVVSRDGPGNSWNEGR